MNYKFQVSRATMRVFTLAVVLALAACCGCGGGGGGGAPFTAPPPAADTTPPTVSSTTLGSALFGPFGGALTITALASDNVGVAGVAAVITKPDGATTTVALSGAGTYTGVYTVPGNLTIADQTYFVRVGASDGSGNTGLGTSTSFVVQSADAPPPPPPF